MTNQLWKPDKQTRASISRGSRKFKKWQDDTAEEISKKRAECRAEIALDEKLIKEQRQRGL